MIQSAAIKPINGAIKLLQSNPITPQAIDQAISLLHQALKSLGGAPSQQPMQAPPQGMGSIASGPGPQQP